MQMLTSMYSMARCPIALWDLFFRLSQKYWSLLDEVVDLNGPNNMVL